MIKVAITVGLLVLATPATAQETSPSTWRDPNTRCVYLKVGDVLSLRYRRDGTPDCASVQQDSTDASITRGDLREMTQQIVLSRSCAGILAQSGGRWRYSISSKTSVAKRGRLERNKHAS